MSVNATKIHEIINSESFKRLVKKRIAVSSILTVIMLVIYFGFILSIAFYRELLSYKIGTYVTLGLPIGIGLILFAWLLTGYYTSWANRDYDKEVRELRNKVLHQ